MSHCYVSQKVTIALSMVSHDPLKYPEKGFKLTLEVHITRGVPTTGAPGAGAPPVTKCTFFKM